MRLSKFLVLFIMLPGAVFAQRTTPDSTFVFSQNLLLFKYITGNGAQLLSSDMDNTGRASVTYQKASGNFRTSQQAENGSDILFTTEGISTVNRFKVYGSFKFSRSWQDSLAWTLQGIPNTINPYYFTAGKAGKYQSINYDMTARLTYRLWKDKLYIGTGVNYFYNTTTRSVDPRPSVQTFRNLLSPEIIYKTGRQTFGLGFLLGYEHESNIVGYKNNVYSVGTQYPDRILYIMQGYGYRDNPKSDQFQRRGRYANINLNYAYADAHKYLRAGFKYQSHDEDIQIPLASSVNTQPIGTFFLNTYEASLLSGLSGSNSRQQLYLHYNRDVGYDNNASVGGAVNYRYSGNTLLFNYKMQVAAASATSFELGINALYANVDKRDISTSHRLRYTYVQPGMEASIYSRFKNNNRLKIMLAPALRLPSNSSLQSPAAVVVPFTYNIAFPEYTYWSSTAGILNLNAEFTTGILIKGVYSGLALNCTFYKLMKTGTVLAGSTFVPSDNFFNAGASFNIYF